MGDDGVLSGFGRALRRARRERDLSQEALASRAGIGAKHVSELERGNKDPRLGTFLRLAAALGLSGTDFMALCERRAEAG